MSDLIGLILQLGIALFLLGLGFFVGSYLEKRHFAHLQQREAELSGILHNNLRSLPSNWTISDPALVTGTAVIATDYFKTFVAGLRSLFGGNIRSLETLCERARRQAVVRMLEEAQARGANVVWNVRLETSTIGNTKGQPGAVEVIAWGTAFRAE